MSDNECRSDRICHEGRCRFPEDVQRERAALASATDAAASPTPDAAVATPALADRFTMTFMGGELRRGRTAHNGPHTLPAERWTFRTGARIFASPLVLSSGESIVASLDKTVSRVRPDGQLAWRYVADEKFYATPTLGTDERTVFAASSDGVVVALDHAGGVSWKRELGSPVEASLLFVRHANGEERLYVAAGGLVALDLAGNIAWRYPTPGRVRSAPTFHPTIDAVLIATTDGKVLALGRTGQLLWEASVGGSIDGAVAISNEGVVVVASDNGQVVGLDSAGAVQFRFRGDAPFRATPAIATDGTIVVGSYDQHVYAIAPNGTARWRFRTNGRIRASARIDADGYIYVGSQDDFLYALTPNGELAWRHNIGQDIDAAASIGSDGTLFVGADDGAVHTFR